MPSHVQNGRSRSGRLAARKTAKKSTSGRPSRAAPPPGTTNEIESVAEHLRVVLGDVASSGRARPSTRRRHGISAATSTTHESSSKTCRNRNPTSTSRRRTCRSSRRSGGRAARARSPRRARTDGAERRAATAASDERQREPGEQERRRHQHERDQQDARPERPRVDVRRELVPRDERRERALVRRQRGPPGPDRLEGVPEARLRGLLVERGVDVGRDERLDRRA